ncbi:MAG: ABC transporter ATP-binding protein [Isosphaeraceae bacterium]
MLEVSGLRKAYGRFVAVDDVSFSVARGESVGLLGPNGAGKTTTVSMICGLLRPDDGRVLVDGGEVASDTAPAKRKLGLVPQELALFEELSADQNLRIFGALYALEGPALAGSIDAAMKLVGLADRARDRVRDFSGGMKRRLNLAAALLHDPELLILDEPTVGVDPQSRNAIFDNLEELKARGKSLLYTTHYMEEAERLCDRIVIIDRGRVVADDTLRGLYGRLPARNRIAVELEGAADEAIVAGLRGVPGVATVETSAIPGHLAIGVKDLNAAMPAVFGWLAGQGARVSHAVTDRPDLEAVFLTLTGRSLRDP